MNRLIFRGIFPSLALAAVTATSGLPLMAAPAQAMQPPAKVLSYVVERDGTAIGTHQLAFHAQDNGRVSVDVETHVAVKAVFVTVYRFDHKGHEDWQGDQLVHLDSKTDDDGTDHTVVADQQDQASGLTIVADGQSREESLPLFPASLWNLQALTQHQLLNTLDGHVMAVSILDKGTETVSGPQGDGPARHYQMTGDLTRDLWFDPQGRLVQVAFKGKDGSAIRYRLNGITPS